MVMISQFFKVPQHAFVTPVLSPGESHCLNLWDRLGQEHCSFEWSHTKASPIPINFNTMRSRERTVNFDGLHLVRLSITKKAILVR